MATFPPRISVRLVDLPALSFLLLKMAILYVLFAFCIKTRKVLKQSSLLDWPFSICGVTRHWMGTFSKQFRCWSSRYQKIWLKTLHLLRTLSSAENIKPKIGKPSVITSFACYSLFLFHCRSKWTLKTIQLTNESRYIYNVEPIYKLAIHCI